VKGLSKNNNSKRDMNSTTTLPTTSLPRESNSSPPSLQSATQVAPQVSEFGQDNKLAENGRRPPLDPGRYLQQGERELSNQSLEYSYSSRELGKVNTAGNERDRQSYTDPSESGMHDVHGADPQETDRIQGGFQARRKVGKEEKLDRLSSRDELSKPDGNSRRQVEYSRDEISKPDGNSRRQFEYNREDTLKSDGNSRRLNDFNRDESSEPDGNSRRHFEYNRDEVSKPDGNSRRQFEYNRDELSKPDGNSRRQFEYNRDEVSKPDGGSRRQFEFNRDEVSKPDGNSRRQFEYNRDEVSKPDGNSRRQFEYNRDEVAKPDGNSRRQFEYNRDEPSKPDGNSRLQFDYNRDETSKTDGNLRRQMEQASNILIHTRIDPEVNPVPYNREGHINAILEVCGF